MTRVHVVVNQKGGVGKTTLTMGAAAVTHAALTAGDDDESPVLVVSTDPQASAPWWADRVERVGGIPFNFAQERRPDLLPRVLSLGMEHVFIDTPGSLEDERMLLAALGIATDVLVPMLPEPLSYAPTASTIERLVAPTGLPFRVVINAWDPRDGTTDLEQTREFANRRGWPVCRTVIRRYKAITRAAAEGLVITQMPANRATHEARADFFRLALELGWGGGMAQGGVRDGE